MRKNTSVPTSAGKWTKQKSDTVLPQRSGTTAWQLSQAAHGTTAQGMRYYRGGADVKNYIRPYYREGAVLGLGATVLRLERSGTTVCAYGTTARACGTTAGACGTTALRSSTTACLRTATLGILLFAKYEENGGCSKAQRERRCKGSKRVRDDSTRTFPTRTPS